MEKLGKTGENVWQETWKKVILELSMWAKNGKFSDQMGLKTWI